MRAYIAPGGCKSVAELRQVERPDPRPRAGQVLVRLRAASLNRRDQAIVTGTYFGNATTRDLVPLSDGAGEVLAVDEGVTRFRAGDSVVASFFQTPPDGSLFAPRAALGSPLDGTLVDQIVLYRGWPRPHASGILVRGSGLPTLRGRHGVERTDDGRTTRQSR